MCCQTEREEVKHILFQIERAVKKGARPCPEAYSRFSFSLANWAGL
jgi:hypothetical protein